jgi:cbb3-type cytochrome oxidase maturation protein
MIPLSLLLGIGFVSAFFWATKYDQFEDLETPAHRILDDTEERTVL